MNMLIKRFPLKNFRELLPLLLRCFPDFWTPRLAEGKYSFPYDVKLFTAYSDNKLIGCIGIHEYTFLLDGLVCTCGGVSDVAIDPDYRGRGLSMKLQEFVLEYCGKHYKNISLLPLYTDKPRVYARLGWKIYESDTALAIPTAPCPPRNTFQFDAKALSLACLRNSRLPVTQEEKRAHRIMEIYRQGKNFNGKCLRSGKTWWELFTDRNHFWHLEDESYFLYRNGTLLEAYSTDPRHEVSSFTPLHGGHDDNKVMVNLPQQKYASDRALFRALEDGSFIFPAADVF